jgi:hypothetical protein
VISLVVCVNFVPLGVSETSRHEWARADNERPNEPKRQANPENVGADDADGIARYDGMLNHPLM